MADFISKMRTSYFKVKDPAAFQTQLDQFENLGATVENEGDKGFCIYGDNFAYVQVDEYDDNGDFVGEREVDLFALISEHLAEGEAVLVNSIGWEKFRYLTAGSAIITTGGVVYADPEETVRQLAVTQNLLTKEQVNKLNCTY